MGFLTVLKLCIKNFFISKKTIILKRPDVRIPVIDFKPLKLVSYWWLNGELSSLRPANGGPFVSWMLSFPLYVSMVHAVAQLLLIGSSIVFIIFSLIYAHQMYFIIDFFLPLFM